MHNPVEESSYIEPILYASLSGNNQLGIFQNQEGASRGQQERVKIWTHLLYEEALGLFDN